jgi:hypothetical protein
MQSQTAVAGDQPYSSTYHPSNERNIHKSKQTQARLTMKQAVNVSIGVSDLTGATASTSWESVGSCMR